MTESLKQANPIANRSSLFVLLLLTGIGSWAFVLSGAGMGGINKLALWSLPYAVTILLMWWGMMVAMMLPSIVPFILLHRRVFIGRFSRQNALLISACLLIGYFIIWGAFSVAATGLQWWLASHETLSMMALNEPKVAAGIFIIVGLYQISPLKAECLDNCQNPLTFVMQNWRGGFGGAFTMGVKHGLYCLGCCWALMLLLFVGGVMNLYWIVALTLYVLIEKFLPLPQLLLERVSAAILILWGLYILITPWLLTLTQ